jgi:hypothetical protein
MDYLGLGNLIGRQADSGFGVATCSVSRSLGGPVTSNIQLTVSDGQAVNVSGWASSDLNYANVARDTFGGDLASACPAYLKVGTSEWFGVLTDLQQGETGVFEYVALMTAVAALAIFIAIVVQGVLIARKAVTNTTEDTGDDPVTWHEDRNGRPYFIVKRRFSDDYENYYN